jgi:Flp pilus assembly secretin CpaC
VSAIPAKDTAMSLRLPAAFAALALLASAHSAAAESLAVPVDQVVRLGLSSSASDVIIGNPSVADVAMIDGRTLAITGKAYGSTNLIVLDSARRTLFNGQITVTSGGSQVSVQRGTAEQRYACVQRCEALPR